MRKGLLCCTMLFIAASAVAQGLYTMSKMEGGMMGGRTSESYLMPKKFKVVEHHTADAAASSIMIIRLDKEVVWTIDPLKRTYSEMTFGEIEGMMKKASGKMDAAMEKMKKEMAGMSDEQRKMVEQMMGNKMPGMQANSTPVRVENTGERKTISGFSCTKYVAKQGDNTIMTLWTTRDVRGFDELRKDWEEFSRRWAAMMPRFGKEMAETYKQIEGFPIQTDLGHGVTTTVTKVERRATPASEFEIPSGYTKVESEMKKGMKEMDEENND